MSGANGGMNGGMNEEWLLLQSQHERYEFAALAIKLFAVALLAFGVTLTAPLLLALLALLWLQEAVVKTFQSRLGERLLRVEQSLREASEGAAMQLHSEWLASRPRGAALLREYALSACRPTVAFPYVVLIVLACWL